MKRFKRPTGAVSKRSLRDRPVTKRRLQDRPVTKRRLRDRPVTKRRWPVERFVDVGRWLQTLGLTVVLTGSVQEKPLTDALQNALQQPAVNLAGKTDLGSLAALLHGARMLVCNDTGVSHLAAALQVPSVVISTGNNPARWAPIDHQLHRTLARPDGVQVDDVIREARSCFGLPIPAMTRLSVRHPSRGANLSRTLLLANYSNDVS
jgi:hypothetical protein